MIPTRKRADSSRLSLTKGEQAGDVAYLVVQAKDGNSHAVESLVRVFADPVLRFLRGRISNRSDAEDVAQNIFAKAVFNLHSVNSEFEPWLWAIVWNELRSHYRKRALPTLAEQPDAAETLEAAPAEIAEEHQRLMDCLTKLDSELKNVIELRFLSDLKLEDIAVRRKIAISTAHARCEKALRQLRACMSQAESRKDD